MPSRPYISGTKQTWDVVDHEKPIASYPRTPFGFTLAKDHMWQLRQEESGDKDERH